MENLNTENLKMHNKYPMEIFTIGELLCISIGYFEINQDFIISITIECNRIIVTVTFSL